MRFMPSGEGERPLSSVPGEDCMTSDETLSDMLEFASPDTAELSAVRSDMRERGMCCDSLRALRVDKVGEFCQTAFLLS